MDRYKALNRTFHHMGLVQSVLGEITNEYAMRLAAHSVPAVMDAQPVEPLANEAPATDRRSAVPKYVHHSPVKQDMLEH